MAKALSLAIERSQAQTQVPAEPEKNEQPVLSEPIGFEATKWNISDTEREEPASPQGATMTATSVFTNVESVITFRPVLPASPPESDSSSPQLELTAEAVEVKPLFLLVDDNAINLKVLSSYMGKIGQAYACASNGLEALEMFCQEPNRYKCVFMDISMPVMDGFEATQRIRAYEKEHGLEPIAIYALSGLATARAQQDARESGVDLFLTKPVRLKELGTILESRGFL